MRDYLGEATLKIYRFLYREGRPMTLSDIQKRAKLSSSSVASYHVSKLLDHGLISQREEGYVADKLLFQNMLRIRRSLVPLQMAFAIFFGTTLAELALFLRPATLSSLYLLALIINSVSLGIFIYETLETLRKRKN